MEIRLYKFNAIRPTMGYGKGFANIVITSC